MAWGRVVTRGNSWQLLIKVCIICTNALLTHNGHVLSVCMFHLINQYSNLNLIGLLRGVIKLICGLFSFLYIKLYLLYKSFKTNFFDYTSMNVYDFQVLEIINIKITVFGDGKSWSLIHWHHRCGRICCTHPQDRSDRKVQMLMEYSASIFRK